MKKSLALICMVLFTGLVMAQQPVPGEKQVPVPVKTKFESEYPAASLKNWEIKPFVKEYVAVFTDQNFNKRARYNAAGDPILLVTSYTKTQVPAAYTSKVMTEYPGFAVDWATEFKFFKTGQHFIELRLSKPGYVLKAWVKPDGSSNANNAKELNASGDPIDETIK